MRYADNAVVTRRDGRLMLRIGSARNALLCDTHFAFHALLRDVSEEGFRPISVVELPLRPHRPAFPVLHMVRHVTDRASPLRGLQAPSSRRPALPTRSEPNEA